MIRAILPKLRANTAVNYAKIGLFNKVSSRRPLLDNIGWTLKYRCFSKFAALLEYAGVFPDAFQHGAIHLHHERRRQGRAAANRDSEGHFPEFFPGAKIGVLGYNGAGKSTLVAHHGRCRHRSSTARRGRSRHQYRLPAAGTGARRSTSTCAATSNSASPKPRRCWISSTRST